MQISFLQKTSSCQHAAVSHMGKVAFIFWCNCYLFPYSHFWQPDDIPDISIVFFCYYFIWSHSVISHIVLSKVRVTTFKKKLHTVWFIVWSGQTKYHPYVIKMGLFLIIKPDICPFLIKTIYCTVFNQQFHWSAEYLCVKWLYLCQW